MRVVLLLLLLTGAASADSATAPGRYTWAHGGFACAYWPDHERILDMLNSGDRAAATILLRQMTVEQRCEIFDAQSDVFVDRVIPHERACIRRPGETRCGWALNGGFTH